METSFRSHLEGLACCWYYKKLERNVDDCKIAQSALSYPAYIAEAGEVKHFVVSLNGRADCSCEACLNERSAVQTLDALAYMAKKLLRSSRRLSLFFWLLLCFHCKALCSDPCMCASNVFDDVKRE